MGIRIQTIQAASLITEDVNIARQPRIVKVIHEERENITVSIIIETAPLSKKIQIKTRLHSKSIYEEKKKLCPVSTH